MLGYFDKYFNNLLYFYGHGRKRYKNWTFLNIIKIMLYFFLILVLIWSFLKKNNYQNKNFKNKIRTNNKIKV